MQVPVDRDLGLVSRLQTRVKELEKEKSRLKKELEKREGLTGDGFGPEGEAEREIYDTIKVRNLLCLKIRSEIMVACLCSHITLVVVKYRIEWFT